MRVLLMLLVVVLSACATAPMAPDHEALFHDELFAGPTERVAAEDIFTPSEAMRRFLPENIAERLRVHGPRQGLVEAMRRDDDVDARDYFAKEIARAEHNAGFRYWMAVASFRLDDRTTAARHLALARPAVHEWRDLRR